MSFKKLSLLLPILLTGCVVAPPPQQYDPATKAKIRLIGTVAAHQNHTCNPVYDKNSILNPVGLIVFGKQDRRVGMPVPTTGYPYKYNEFVIQAGVPQTVVGSADSGERYQRRNAYGGIDTTVIYCTKSVYFTPKPGHMYDFMAYPGGRDNCYVEITDITADVNNPEKVAAQPTDFCKDDED